MTHICLVVPSNRFDRYFIQVPLDVANAAGELRALGHQVTVWDQRLDELPPAADPDLAVVFTAIADRAQCYPLDLGPIQEGIRRLREVCPGARTVAVGPHATHLPESTQLDLGVDHVAGGEADSAAVAAVRRILAGHTEAVLTTEPGGAPVIPLGEFSPAAFDLLPMSRYTSGTVVDGQPHHGPCGMVLAARGCTYGCTFCHLPFGTRIRRQPTDKVMAELIAQREMGIDFVFFLDYVFGIDKAFYGELCQRLRGQGINWIGQTRAEIVLRSDVSEWAAAGCRGMWLGAESPSVDGAGVHKRVSQDKTEAAVAKLKDAGILPYAFLLIGLPEDEACLSNRIVDWVGGLGAWFGLNQLYLRPGTTLYDELAPGLNGGQRPRSWAEVNAVTERYRREYPIDLDAQERELAALPNFLANGLVLA